jgi:hypothetical protein
MNGYLTRSTEQIDRLLLSRRPTSLLASFPSCPARQTLDGDVRRTTEWSPDLHAM